MLTRDTLLTVDFLNKCIFSSINRIEKIVLTEDLLQKFLAVVDPFWNTDKDKIDYFSFFNTNEYFCQRRKLKYDFSTQTSSWTTYEFKGASVDQAKEFFELCKNLFGVAAEVKTIIIDAKIEEVEKESIFFEQRYVKKRKEKDTMLEVSDWRVLPDIEDSYPNEKQMWIKWRAELRRNTIKKPSEFENNLEFFKYTYDIKFPVDPNVYRKLYPNGMLEDGVTPAPEYLDPNDLSQWVKYDSEASNDFVNSRMRSIYNLGDQYSKSYRKINQNVLDLMKLMEVDDLVDVDWSIYYTENDTNITFE